MVRRSLQFRTNTTAELVETRHAKGFENISGLTVFRPPQGFSTNHVEVYIELNCGEQSLETENITYVVRLRRCHVELLLENAHALRNSAYECYLQQAEIKINHQKTVKDTTGLEAEIDVNAGMSIGFVPWLSGKLKGKASKKRTNALEDSEKSRPPIHLITKSGAHRWDVGDPTHGDKRQPDGLLYGTYFAESRERDGDTPPLVVVGVDNPSADAPVMVAVIAKYGQLSVTPPKRRTLLATSFSEADSDAVKRDLERRSRLAGIAIAKQIRERQRKSGIAISDAELLLAAGGFIVRGSDDRLEGQDK